MSGVKEILDSTCNMLSAVTNIPQTILFGRSPAGENSTGENDMENYYNMVENIQKQNMKANSRIVLDLILKQGYLEGKIPEIPRYKVKFSALWSMSEKEQAEVDRAKAETERTKAETAKTYIDSGAVDPSEVRRNLAAEGEFQIEELLTEEDLDIPEDTFSMGQEEPAQAEAAEDAEECEAAAILVIDGGKILCGTRRGGEGVCGPGGHIEDGESAEQGALREAQEEFNIVPLSLIPIGVYKPASGDYCVTKVYMTDKYTGKPEADGLEMMDAEWLSRSEERRVGKVCRL